MSGFVIVDTPLALLALLSKCEITMYSELEIVYVSFGFITILEQLEEAMGKLKQIQEAMGAGRFDAIGASWRVRGARHEKQI